MTHGAQRMALSMPTIIFILFALIGVPLFAMFGGVALYSYNQAGMSPIAIISEYYKLASQPVLLTIPLFTFAGYLLAESKAPTRTVNVAKVFLGWMPGGLAIVTIFSCAFFTAFTGASGVTIIALGGLMYPILIKDKYGDKFSMGMVTCCGSVGLLFAPSLPLILYGLIGGVGIDRLFIAGVLPGFVIVFILALYSIVYKLTNQARTSGGKSKILIFAKSLGYLLLLILLMLTAGAALGGLYWLAQRVFAGFSACKFMAIGMVVFIVAILILHKIYPQKVAIKVLREAIWEIPLPALILVSIYGGYITPSEAAAVTAFYVLIVETFVYRDINLFSDLPRIIRESMLLVGGILIILGVAMGMTNLLIQQEVPYHIFNWVSQFIHTKWMFLVALNLFLLVVGCLMDIFSAIIVVVPIITPIAIKYGVDPIHLAMIFLTNLEIGYLTPPVGLNLFISSFRFNRPVVDLYRISLPYLLLLIVSLLLITYIPWFSLSLLNALGM